MKNPGGKSMMRGTVVAVCLLFSMICPAQTMQWVVSAAYDSITPFYDGFALAMNRMGNRMKIEALISDGDYYLQPVTDNVYATRYVTFSEGKLPVQGEEGWGYLGTDGNMAIPLQFTEAYPFSDGWASVMMEEKGKKQIYYIDRDMNIMEISEGGGVLAFASTFSGGKAVVYTRYGMKGYEIDTGGRTIGRYKVAPDAVRVNADHSVGDKPETRNGQTRQRAAAPDWQVFEESGSYGYKYKGKVVLPPQFEKAEPVKEGYAVVRYKGQVGILKIAEGTVAEQTEVTLIKSDTLHHEVVTKKESGKGGNGGEGVVRPASFTVSSPTGAKRANPKDVFYVTVAVKNQGDEAGTATITLYDNGRKVGTSRVSVRAHGTAYARIGIPEVTKPRFADVKAVLANGVSAVHKNMELRPFY